MKVSKKIDELSVCNNLSLYLLSSSGGSCFLGGTNSLKSALEVLLCIPFNNPLVNDTQWKNH